MAVHVYTVGQAIIYTFPLSFLGGVMPDLEVHGVVTDVKEGRRGQEVALLIQMPKGPWGPAAEHPLHVYASDLHLRPA